MALGASHAMTNVKNSYALAGQYADGGYDERAADRASRSGDEMGTLDQTEANLWRLPLRANYQVSSPFGPRDYPNPFHNGFDMSVPEGTNAYAAADGKITLARYDGGYGNSVRIDLGSGVVLVYGHLSRILVTEGQTVQAGTLIGLTGNTGYSTGPHLHFEIDIHGTAVDPVPIVLRHGIDLHRHIEVYSGGVL